MPPDVLQARRRAVADGRWTWLRQIHGSSVVTVRRPGDAAGEEADAAVTDVPGAVLAVHVADCAPIALVSPEGVVGVAHGGWRGLHAGVVGNAADAMRSLGATAIDATVGPCIHPECYEFGEDELGRLESRFGAAVRGRTSDGSPALDLPATVARALDDAGVDLRGGIGPCTACSTRWFSHRARADRGRQAVVVWIEGAG